MDARDASPASPTGETSSGCATPTTRRDAISVQTQADGGEWRFEYLRPCEPGRRRIPLPQCAVTDADDVATSAVVTDPRGR